MDEALKLKRATYNLWTFTTSKIISSFGAQVYAFAISFYILQLTGSATSFATNLICNILPRTLMAPFAGYVADKYSRKTIVITAQIASTLAIGGLVDCESHFRFIAYSHLHNNCCFIHHINFFRRYLYFIHYGA